ncbi:ABC transporter substrate-binding protein [Hylemonella gracilis]|uniref:ABC transporter substrate-binding protein n=1 Tax=Hylemonella gracilis TaxID=80880 RepID=UPI0013F14349|nr:ABC transporter substrate binding protein [Hylemonella gracilis]
MTVAVSSGTGAAYEQAAQALERSLAQALRQDGKTPIFVRVDAQDETAALKSSLPAPPRLYIALGVQACTHLARQTPAALVGAPVLCALLPRQSFEYLLRETGRRAGPDFSALYLNQPLARQLDLIRLALPQARRIGVLVGAGPGAQQMEDQLTELARERGLRLVSARLGTSDPIFPGLKQVLDESDVLLAMADPQIYNSHTIQNILLASFRAKVPMQAFSPAYVRAGALLALYATPEQIGAQVASLVRDALTEQNGRARGLGPPLHTQWFEVSVNAHVARSLGLQLDADDLAERLRRLESKAGQERKSSAPHSDARDRLAQVGVPWGSW